MPEATSQQLDQQHANQPLMSVPEEEEKEIEEEERANKQREIAYQKQLQNKASENMSQKALVLFVISALTILIFVIIITEETFPIWAKIILCLFYTAWFGVIIWPEFEKMITWYRLKNDP